MKLARILGAAIASSLLLAAAAASPAPSRTEPQKPIYKDASQPVEKRAEDLLSRMTLEEKIGQMNMPCVYEDGLGKTIPEKMEGVRRFAEGTWIKGFGPGGGFFTLPNNILLEGPRQQAEFMNDPPEDRRGKDAAGNPAPADGGRHPRPDVLRRNHLPRRAGPRHHLGYGAHLSGLCGRGRRGALHRHPPNLHARRRAHPRPEARAQ